MRFNICGAITMGNGGNSAMDGRVVAQLGWVMAAATWGEATISQVK
jgi:hypothetical protein